jgi:ribonucleoside-diphosphate reductase alpha chain
VLRGLFTADGTVADYDEKSQYVSLDSTSRELLRQVQLLLLSFGIKSKLYENRRALGQSQAMLPDGRGGHREYPVQQMHSLRISRRSRVVFEEMIGFIEGTEKARRLAELNRRVETYRDELVDRIASLTPCGEEDVYDLTEPRTHHFVANGVVVHNCSEYMFLDNTACNLASINLMKLYRPADKSFDLEGFEHAIRLWTVVLEISVLMAAFPSKEIARLSYEYRTLGLGFANLGAMLMQAGIPYDSDTGRAIAGAISATMTGRSYATSAEMAAEHGPFAGYFKNREPMLRVMRNHRRAAYGVPRDPEADAGELGPYEDLEIAPVPIEAEHLEREPRAFGQLSNSRALLAHARAAWDEAIELGEQHGYRNAQTTVIAPTGTIGLLMDCDTTGVEPDFALVKFKKLAGGGYFKIANQSLRPALRALGYDEPQVRDIMAYVMGVQTLDVPMPNLEGEIAADNPTFKAYLKHKGVGDEELGRLTDALGSAMELSFAFNAFVLGEDAVKRMGLDPAGDLLKQLGLNRKQIDVLNEAITGTGTVEGAPHLKAEHLPVFDCANKCGRTGQRFIAPQGHIRMMAAVQPFISGAISKTINLPHEADVEAIKACYRLSWELGLKANALYRDGSKLSQVLSATSDEAAEIDAEVEDEEAIEAAKKEVTAEASATADRIASAATEAEAERLRQPVEKIVERIVERPLRRRLPNTRRSLTHKFNVAGHEGYLTVGLYDDGQPGELFITMAKEGSTIGGLMDTLGTAISVSLQYGVPVESLVNKFTHARFEPAGMTDNRDIPFAKSLVDYIFRWMGMEFVQGYREANAPKRASDAGAGGGQTAEPGKSAGQASTPKSSDRTDSVPDDRAGATHGSGAPARLDQSPGEGNGGRLAELHASEQTRIVAIDDPELAAEHQRRHGPLNDLQKGNAAAMAAAERQNATAAALASTLNEANSQMMGDAPACDVCGSITVRNGTCYKCLNCGNSMGCS